MECLKSTSHMIPGTKYYYFSFGGIMWSIFVCAFVLCFYFYVTGSQEVKWNEKNWQVIYKNKNFEIKLWETVLRENKIYNECVIACIDASLVEQKFLFFIFLSDSIKVRTWITRLLVFSLIFSRMNNGDGKIFMKNQYRVHHWDQVHRSLYISNLFLASGV